MSETAGRSDWSAVVVRMPPPRRSLEEVVALFLVTAGIVAVLLWTLSFRSSTATGAAIGALAGLAGILGLVLLARALRPVWSRRRARRAVARESLFGTDHAGLHVVRVLAGSSLGKGGYRLTFRGVGQLGGEAEMPTVWIDTTAARFLAVSHPFEAPELPVVHASRERVGPIMLPVLALCAIGVAAGISEMLRSAPRFDFQWVAVVGVSFVIAGGMIVHWWRYFRLRLVVRDGRAVVVRGRREVCEISPANTFIVCSRVWTLVTRDVGTLWVPLQGVPATAWGECARAAAIAWRHTAVGEKCVGCGYLLDGLPMGGPCPECGLAPTPEPSPNEG